jgi:signal transduction histidine kinase
VDPVQIDFNSLSTPTFFQLQEEERYRLAHALMDGPGQVLANALVELEHSLALLETNPQAAQAGIASLRDEIRGGLAQLKTFVAELQPPLLAELGLGPSLRQYAENFGLRNGLEVECNGCNRVRARLPDTIETAVFRIVQEALANVAAHSGATSVRVRLARVANQVQVEVEDNGRGFATREPADPKRRQLGLVGMADRARLVGGHLQIFSEAGKGLRVVLTVPYHGQAEESTPAAGGRNENGRETQNGRERGAKAQREPSAGPKAPQSGGRERSRANLSSEGTGK